ncbi:MAG: nucleotide exchange factor GrpE [Chitinophagaceae bacterium]|nr:nucleotide exchange factor GrpE [Chitinophagaceae bacterium]
MNKNAENQEDIKQKGASGQDGDENLTDTPGFPEDLTGEVEKLNAELAEQKDKYVRLYADFDNFKRRNAKERVELIQTAGKEVIVSLLEVLDDCDRAEKQIQETGVNDAVTEGVQLVFNKLRAVLNTRGLKPMDVKGKEFDPDQEEAIGQVPAPSEDLKGKVVDEVVKGYYLNDKIIRFAKVVVGQ